MAAAVIVAIVVIIAIVFVLFVQSIKHTDSYDLFSQSLVFTLHSILMRFEMIGLMNMYDILMIHTHTHRGDDGIYLDSDRN